MIMVCTTFQVIGQTENKCLEKEDLISANRRGYFEQELGIKLPTQANLSLYDTLTNWIGTPYRFAGNCEKGIDCSGFVSIIYDHVYGKKMGARNSAEIYNLFEKVDKSELEEGDLVFFRIHKKRISHVGIFLGNDKFAHSCTSGGVTISDLKQPYYKKYFAGAGRHKAGTFDTISQTSTP
jgi:lipoprotein Spr